MDQKEKIIKQAEQLRDKLAETDEVAFYRTAEARIHENEKIKQKIAAIKDLQKQAVNLEHYQKHEALRQVEQQIKELNEEIDRLPIVTEYRRAQLEANDLIQLLTKEIAKQISQHIEK
ncbi:RicAFT regulatory complex protein RicA family protein [Listeria sp. PSOL-1]|uniref:RicAFT regulatory complex protein RicA family protein n=1 Tax=Listeria sp. PSOL-1 TaxID=1844999 RepID=UPI0013D05612|nr:YlbF family regulator [Listeria sp. PSOL-1]